MSRKDEIEARRAERKAERQAQADEQYCDDLEAIDSIDAATGDSNVAIVRVPYTVGQPVLIAARCPTPVELKRYRDMVKPRKDGSIPDAVAAAELVADVARIYPEPDVYKEICKARPGVAAQLGLAALNLAVGQEAEAGKD